MYRTDLRFLEGAPDAAIERMNLGEIWRSILTIEDLQEMVVYVRWPAGNLLVQPRVVTGKQGA